MKKSKTWLKIGIAAVVVLVMLAEALLIWNYAPKKPFADLREEDIAAVYVLTSETKTFAVEQEQWSGVFVRGLQQVTLYGRLPDDATAWYFDSPILFRLELKNGKSYLIHPLSAIVRINGKVYETNYLGWASVQPLIAQWWFDNALEQS